MEKIDYVKFYAEKMRDNNQYFKQQKMLIDSQIIASRSLFKNKFKGSDFKKEAREYLREVGLL